jgi:hypothetical protein
VINHNGSLGFSCIQSSVPKMVEGEISENGGGGLVVLTQAKGRWENVLFRENKGDAVMVSDAGRPVLRQCRIVKTEGAGIRFRNQAQGTIEDTEITESGGPGIEVEGGANPALRKVRVLNGRNIGIVVHSLGGGSADNCVVRDNASGDWEMAPNARLARVGC